MQVAEAIGHIAVLTLVGIMGLFLGLSGLLVGLCLLVGWIFYTKQ